MKILITGYRGFVGRHFHAALDDGDNEIVGIDLSEGDDATDFFAEDGSTDYDLVLHLAALVGGRKIIEGTPLALATRDLVLDASLFRWAARTKPGRVVYFSSSAAYPMFLQREPGHRLTENDINFNHKLVGVPDLSYGWIKLTGERLAQWAQEAGLAVSVVRPFSGYGADQDPAYPFPALAARAIRQEDPFKVWGSGRQSRDFIHIDDIVGATLKMVAEGIDGPVNLGTGRATTFRDLARMFMEAAGYKADIYPQPDEPVGAYYRVADVILMRSFYPPQVTLEEGIERTLRVMREV